jgi:hypothetical protein
MFLLYSGCYAICIFDKSEPQIQFPAHTAHKCHTFSSPVLARASLIVDAVVIMFLKLKVPESERYSQI